MQQHTPQLKDILKNDSNIKNRYISDKKKLKTVVDSFKSGGYRIVLTQGVYDLIHEGHARYLEAAKSHGDILIVSLDSDALTKQRKGPNRPIVPQEERITMLAHLRSVDVIALRDVDQDPNELVQLISPDVFIVSETTKDFAEKRMKECKKYCGTIITLPAQATTSTTARIRNLTIEGAQNLATEINKLTIEFLDKIKNA